MVVPKTDGGLLLLLEQRLPVEDSISLGRLLLARLD